MTDTASWFQLNTPNVVYDVVDDEVVFVDLETGAYYSTEKDGLLIWHYINAGCTVEEIVTALSSRYAGQEALVKETVTAFVEQLSQEAIVVAGSGAPPASADEVELRTAANDDTPFVGVDLHKFVDMQDLLLLDPVHEVDERGWPHADTGE